MDEFIDRHRKIVVRVAIVLTIISILVNFIFVKGTITEQFKYLLFCMLMIIAGGVLVYLVVGFQVLLQRRKAVRFICNLLLVLIIVMAPLGLIFQMVTAISSHVQIPYGTYSFMGFLLMLYYMKEKYGLNI